MEEPQIQETSAEAPKKKRGGGLTKLLMLIVLLAAAGGGGAWWWLHGTPAAAAQEPSLEEQGLLSFDPFLVNLVDAGGNRLLKTNIQLVLSNAEDAKHVSETPVVLMHLRSAILELLAQQSAAVLVTPDGKAELKNAIKTRTGALLTHQKVIDVLFSEFIVQF